MEVIDIHLPKPVVITLAWYLERTTYWAGWGLGKTAGILEESAEGLRWLSAALRAGN